MRKIIFFKLKEIILSWIMKVAWQHPLAKQQIHVTCVTNASYDHKPCGTEFDIDFLCFCVGTIFATTLEESFIFL